MLKGLINRVFKTKLALKIWFYMVLPTLAVLLFIDISLNSYFNHYTISTSINNAKNDTQYVSSSFSDNYTDILKRFVRKTSSTAFKVELTKILNCTTDNYINENNALQNLFTDYTQMNNLIKSVMIARTDKNAREPLLFYAYNWRLSKDIHTYDLGLDLSDIKGITILPHTSKPFTNQSEVIPIAIPLKYDKLSNMVLIADHIEKADIIFYLFLGSTELKNYLDLYCKDASQGTLFFVNAYGENLSLHDSRWESLLSDDSDISITLRSLLLSDGVYGITKKSHIYLNQLNGLDLYLVNVIPHTLFTQKTETIRTVFFSIGLISLVIITCLSLMISLFVTRPLKKLMVAVHDIEANTYNGKPEITTKDEIGQLNLSIDSMYHTIQQQFETIKQEENEKYQAKMQMLTEQMNPHFLYNALECINMEVISNHADHASSMISSLGDYLRVGLAYGDNFMFISQELEQVMAYVNIMNFRFNDSIQVTTNVPDTLLYQKLPKTIIQPLVENSLKHGFKMGLNSKFPILPIIDITITLDETHFILTVTDNGEGIHVEHATQIMYNKHSDGSKDQHVGLNNIYQRLQATYGAVDITFSSIPFFENKVIITIPAQTFNKAFV